MRRPGNLLAGVVLVGSVLVTTACASAHNGAHAPTTTPTTGHASSSSCAPAGSRTVAQGSRARVIKIGHTYYGCLERAGRLVRLGGDACLGGGSGSVSLPRVASDTVGYVLMRCGVDTGNAEVISTDLRTQMVLRRSAANLAPSAPESFASVSDLVVKADGALAWISSTSSIVGHSSSVEVDRVDRRGVRMLDHGAGIVTGSLRLSAARVSWERAGRRHASNLT